MGMTDPYRCKEPRCILKAEHREGHDYDKGESLASYDPGPPEMEYFEKGRKVGERKRWWQRG